MLIVWRSGPANNMVDNMDEVDPSGQQPKPPLSTSSIRSMPSTQSTKSRSTFPEIAANAALVLITVACSLLDRQLAAQAVAFEREGGFTERLYRVRSNARKNTK